MQIQTINPGQISKEVQTKINTLYGEALASNTRRAYKNDWQEFTLFCEAHHLDSLSASPEAVAAYISHLQDVGRKISTIRRKVATISSAYAESGLPKPTDDRKIKNLLKGCSNTQKRAGLKVKEAKAITLAELEKVCTELLNAGTVSAIRDRAILVIGFFGAFRRSELAGLTWEQIGKSDKGFTVELTEAKNINEGESQIKVFPYRSNIAVCPVRALEALTGFTSTGQIFFNVSKLGRISTDSFYDKQIDRIVKKHFGNDYSAHSLRAGFITEAGRRNIGAVNIAHQTGHKTLQMIQKYTRFADAWEGNAAISM